MDKKENKIGTKCEECGVEVVLSNEDLSILYNSGRQPLCEKHQALRDLITIALSQKEMYDVHS